MDSEYGTLGLYKKKKKVKQTCTSLIWSLAKMHYKTQV